MFKALPGIARFIVIVVLVLLVCFVAAVFFSAHFVFATINYTVDRLAGRSGLSPFLVRGVAIIATIPFFWAIGMFVRNVLGLLALGWNPLSFYRNRYGLIIIGYIGLFFFAMYWTSLDAYAYKYCADTPEGVFASDGSGKDPVYGFELKPCTVGQIKELRAGEGVLQSPRELHAEDVDTFAWFDGLTGKPRVWYAVLPNGDYSFFDRPGSDPHSGQILQAISPDVVQRMRQRQGARQAAERDEAARQQAEASRKKEESDLQSLTEQAKAQFDGGDYKSARASCDHVLAQMKGAEPCITIRAHSSVKLAQRLVTEGMAQFQRGHFDEALWSAEEAIKFDPANSTAVKLKQLASQVKPNSIN